MKNSVGHLKKDNLMYNYTKNDFFVFTCKLLHVFRLLVDIAIYKQMYRFQSFFPFFCIGLSSRNFFLFFHFNK